MDAPQRVTLYKDGIDKLRFIFETYVFAIAVLEGKREIIWRHQNEHPLELLFLYSYYIDKAIEVLSEGNDIIGRQLKYYKEIKQALDVKSAGIINEKYSPDEVNKLLLGFVEERANEYDYYVKNIYPHTPNDGYYLGNLSSLRSFLEGLLERLQTRNVDISEIVDQISTLDAILKRDADVNWISGDTEKKSNRKFRAIARMVVVQRELFVI